MKRRLLAMLLVLLMIIPTGLASALEITDFNDLPSSKHWSYDGVVSVIQNGIMEGYGDGTFRPDSVITLAEASAYIVRAMKASVKATELKGISGYKAGAWYDTQGVVSIAYNMGLLDGIIEVYGGAVTPDTPLTSEDAFDMMARAVHASGGDIKLLSKFADAAETSSVYAANIAALVEGGYILGSGDNGVLNLAPLRAVTRARFATLFARIFTDYISAPGEYSNKTFSGTVINVSDVTLKNTVINGDLIIGDGVGDGDVTLDTVTVNGHIIVRGGGTNSIIIKNSDIKGDITIARTDGAVRVYIENTEVEIIYVNDGKDDVIIEGKVGTVTVENDVPVIIKGEADAVIITAKGAEVTLANGSSVGTVNILESAENTTVNCEAGVKAAKMTVAAKNTDINTASGSTIGSLIIEKTASGTDVTGSGRIDSAVVNAPDTDLGKSLNIGTITDNTDPSSGTSGDGGSSGGGGSTPPQILTNAAQPQISVQPSGATYEENAVASALTVSASVSDGGTLSYQWYSNTTNSTNGGQAISGATNSSYVPDVSVAGTVYYYVVVTNTNNNVSGQKTASVTSSVAAVVTGSEETLSEFTYIITPDAGYKADGEETAMPIILTASGLEDMWYEFDLSVFDIESLSYALYFKNGGSVSFNRDVTLTKTIMDESGNYVGTEKAVDANEPIIMSAEWNEYSLSLADGNSIILVYAPNAGNYASLTPDKPLSEFPGTVKLGDAPDSVVMGITVGAAREGVFAERTEITIEKGTSVRLTALMKVAVSVLLRENRSVTWDFDENDVADLVVVDRSATIPGLKSTIFTGSSQLSITGKKAGTFTINVSSDYSTKQPLGKKSATITVNVVESPERASPQITIASDGVQDWSYNLDFAETYLGFTADVHYDRTAAAGENLYRLWMQSLQSKGIKLDYMALVGDNISAYASGLDAWNNMNAIIQLADSFSPAFVKNKTLFLMGNHERWQSGGMHYDETKASYPAIAARLSQNGETYSTVENGYVLYDFGATWTPDDSPYYGGSYGGNGAQEFMDEHIEKLDEFLATIPSDIPAFIMSHYPIHTYISPEGTERESGNAAKLLNMLNKYPNVIFLWGHNHSSADPKYDHVLTYGDVIEVGSLDYGESMVINFVYADAGCMSDFEYRSSLTSTSIPGGALIKGKSMVAAVDGSDVTLIWYSRPEIPQPDFNVPVEITAATPVSDVETITLFNSAEYRILTKGDTSHEWYDSTMYSWSATLLSRRSDIVVLGFRSTDRNPLNGLAELSYISGYGSKVTGAALLEPGSWAVVESADKTMVFIIISTYSDGNIWLPGELPGGEEVWDLQNQTIKIYSENGITSTWQELLDSVMMINPVKDLDVEKNNEIDCEAPYSLKFGDIEYRIIHSEPLYELPEDLAGIVPDELAKAIYKSGNNYDLYVGYDAYYAANGESGAGVKWNTNGMTQTSVQNALNPLGEKLLILCIGQFTDLSVPASIPAYGGEAISSGSTFTLLANTPGSWAYYISSNRGFILLNPVSDELAPLLQDAEDTKTWRGYDAYLTDAEAWSSDDLESVPELSLLGANLTIIGVKPEKTDITLEIEGYDEVTEVADLISTPLSWCLVYEDDATYFLKNSRISPLVPFLMPTELSEFIDTSGAAYSVWYGYDDFTNNAGSFGSILGVMGSSEFGTGIGEMAEKIVVVAIKAEAQYPQGGALATALAELEIVEYGGVAVSHGIGTNSGKTTAEALVAAGVNRWVVTSSTSYIYAYIIFSIDSATP